MLLRWYIITLLLITGGIILGAQGTFTWIWSVDHSKLSVVDLILFTLSTAYTGVLTYRISNGDRDAVRSLRFVEFATQALMACGMIGTLWGFMSMFSSNMAKLDVSNVETVKQVIVQLTHGFATGIITTLVGLATSLLLTAQLVNVQTMIEE